MVIDAPFLRCFFCGRRFSPDMEVREGQFIHTWKVAVCLGCLERNRDGLSASHPAIRQLAQRGIILKPSRKDEIVRWPENEGGPKPGIPLP